MLEALFAPHGADRPALAIDDHLLHALRRSAIGKIAIAVEEALAAVDPEREEDARHIAGHEFAHREHVGAHPQRRQDLEHVVMLALGDLEPLAGEEVLGIAFGDRRIAAVAVEHAIHLGTRGDAFEDLADGG